MCSHRSFAAALLFFAAPACSPNPPSPASELHVLAAAASVAPTSARTQQRIGVSTWRYELQLDGSARIEGLGADGSAMVVLHASTVFLDSDEFEPVAYSKVLADGSEVALTQDDSNVAAFRADVADPQSTNVQRNLDASATSMGGKPRAREKDLSTQVRGSRELLKCMRRFAGQAYTKDHTQLELDCDFAPSISTDVTKVFSGSNPSVESLLIAFAGTRFPDIGDVARDLQSQAPVYHQNPLGGSLPALGYIGAGWDARWNTQANIMNLASILDSHISDAKSSGKPLEVFVVGHSLGGVTASVAGYDVAQYLKGKGVSQAVYVYTFDSPRMGSGGARDTYRDALFASVCPASGEDVCLTLREFTRTYDPVQSVPQFMEHPVWQIDPLDMTVGPGSHAGQALGYCAQFNAPYLALPWPWTVIANHELGPWDSQLDAMPDEQVFCMFANR